MRVALLVWLEAPLVLLSTIEALHENKHREGTNDNRDGQQQRIHDRASNALTTRLQRPGPSLVTNNQSSGQVRLRRGTDMKVVRQETIHDTITAAAT